MKKILFISNGHGEDLVAAEIIRRLKDKAEMTVLPVVGKGAAFASLGVKVLGSRKELPSGGFSLRNPLFLARDIYAGLIGNTLEQLRLLKEREGQFDLTVAIGDIVPILGALRAGAPFIFVGVNKSSYYKWFGYNYTPWEKLLLQKHALKVFVRDKVTEDSLRNRGIKIKSAEYVGNPLMDCLSGPIQRPQPQPAGLATIGFLPGTREDARANMEDFEKVAEELIKTKDPDSRLRFITAAKLEDIPEYIENMPFERVLSEADLILGLSGTGNEQAAGCGIPVVSFYGRGSQYNRRFAGAQKQLLDESLSLVRDSDPIVVAAEVWQLLRNPRKMNEMGESGKERMGKPGAAQRIADFILRQTSHG